jgi:methylenetetrahydrofolate dehydrogenase (NADP+)/methenyltetrahydrofolate cyclohydrolase
MTARMLLGEPIAQAIKAELAAAIRDLAAAGLRPGLGVVVVGNHAASQIYVRNKITACEELGIACELHTPPESVTTAELLALVAELNGRDDLDGVLLQMPLPAHVDEQRVLMAVDPAKDVDGFQPLNYGLMAKRQPTLVPCTAAGIIKILEWYQIPIDGAEAVVVGRSANVGRPTAVLLANENATSTLAHSHTRNLAEVTRRADILVAAIGRAGLIDVEYVKPGATVIDVGINHITDRAEFQRFFAGNARREKSFAEKGSTIVGDVHPRVAQVAGALTPVPGGVGPMTVAMLLVNTVKACRMRRGMA